MSNTGNIITLCLVFCNSWSASTHISSHTPRFGSSLSDPWTWIEQGYSSLMQGCRNRCDGTTTTFTNNILFPKTQRFFITCTCHLPIHPFSSEGSGSFNIQKFLLRQKLWIIDTIKLTRNVSTHLFIPPECIKHPLLHTTTSSKDCGPGHAQSRRCQSP